jgi:hypothetical protein
MTITQNKDENRYRPILAKLSGEVLMKQQFQAGGVRGKFTTRNRRYEGTVI